MKSVEKVQEFEAAGFIPVGRPGFPPHPMSRPFNWSSDPYEDSNWCFQLQTLRYLMVYLSAYQETEERKFLTTLIDWFHDWWQSAKSDPSRYAWHDMATGIRAEKIHLVAKAIESCGTRKPAWFQEMILAHVKLLREEGFIRINHNHGLYAVHGLRCLAEHIGPGMRKNVLNYVYCAFERVIKNQFDENYVHREHSPHYHHLVLKSLKEYKRTGLYNCSNFLDKYIEGAEKIAPILYLPDGREIPFGDTDNQEVKEVKDAENWGQSEDRTLWCSSGYAIYKERNRYLCLTNSYNSRIHKHCDNLSIIYGDAGRDVLVDPGKYKYSDDEIRRLITSAACHNTINVEPHGWTLRDLNPRSLSTEVFECNGRVFFEAAMQIKMNSLCLAFGREIEVLAGGIYIKDKALGNHSGDRLASSFIFSGAARIESRSMRALIIDIDGVCFEFEVRTDIDNGIDFVYEVESCPVSHSYASYMKTLQIKVYFHSALETRISLLLHLPALTRFPVF